MDKRGRLLTELRVIARAQENQRLGVCAEGFVIDTGVLSGVWRRARGDSRDRLCCEVGKLGERLVAEVTDAVSLRLDLESVNSASSQTRALLKSLNTWLEDADTARKDASGSLQRIACSTYATDVRTRERLVQLAEMLAGSSNASPVKGTATHGQNP